MQFNLVRRDGDANLTFVVDGKLYPVDDNHPDFDGIVEAVLSGDEAQAVYLFDASVRAAERFESLSDRVTVAHSRVYVDQHEVDDVYADTLVSFLENDASDDEVKALVNFLEKVYSNVSEGIRENLSRWLKAENFSILSNGNILGYRGLNDDYTSKHAGPGIVNGQRVNGHLDNSVGNTVELDADLVENNPSVGCASGLHVGTYNYAQGWAGSGVVVSVEVDPRHVRSVPFECDSQKMRVSKYVVKETVAYKKEDNVYAGYDANYDDYDEYANDDYGYTY